MSIFTGSCAAMVTPFGKDGKIDVNVLHKLIDKLIAGGTNAIVVAGTTGEPATMTKPERDFLLTETISYVNKRVPVIAGTGSNSTATSIENSVNAEKLGADALLIVTPYYNKCTQKGLVAHYGEISKSVSKPIILYNVPTRTRVNIEPETIYDLAKLNNVCAIKEANGEIDHIQAMSKAVFETGLDMYTGDDSLTMISYALGGIGLISVAANVVPEKMSELCAFCASGDYENAKKLTFKLMPLMKALFVEVNPIPAKKALQLVGVDVGAPRLPLTECEPIHTEMLRAALKDLGIKTIA